MQGRLGLLSAGNLALEGQQEAIDSAGLSLPSTGQVSLQWFAHFGAKGKKSAWALGFIAGAKHVALLRA